jgi:pimeloyl-ACP methyl ester carboxylesterase
VKGSSLSPDDAHEAKGITTLVLPDGRRIDVRSSGPEDGLALVFHHGTPGAATAVRVLERAAHRRGLRLITTSRPGYGDSTRLAGRSVAHVVSDTASVLSELGIDRCLVAGWSGGGPHALACAARLPATVAALVIAGVAPFDAEDLDWTGGMGEENLTEFGAAVRGETALLRYLEEVREHLNDVRAENIVSSLGTILPDVDRVVLSEEFGEDMAAGFHEGLRLGADGWADDDLAFTKPWGFDLTEVAVPVALWHGTEDLMVPFAHGKWLSSHVPGAAVHLEEGEGHLSIGVGAVDRMLDELIELAG